MNIVFALLLAIQDPKQEVEVVDFRDVPLADAMRMFSEMSNLRIVVTSEAAKLKVTLYIKNVAPMAAIDALCKAHNLWYKRDAATDIIHIHTMKEYRRDLLSFREVKTEIFTLLYPNSADVANAIRDLFGERVRISDTQGLFDASDDLARRFERFDEFSNRGQGLGLFGGGGGGGGDRQTETQRDERQNRQGGNATQQLRQARTQPKSREQELQDFLKGLTPDQILAVEKAMSGEGGDTSVVAELLRRHQSTIYVSVVSKSNKLMVRTSDPEAMDEIRRLVRRLDVPTPLVLLEVKIISVDIGDGFRSVFDYQYTRGKTTGTFTDGNILPPAPGSKVPGGTGLLGGHLTFQWVDQVFAARLQLLQSKNKVRFLATPLLITANNEVSRLFVGEERPINRSFTGPQTLVTGPGLTTTTPGSTAIEFRNIGTSLIFTPNINEDRTVTLRLLQESSRVSTARAPVLVPTAAGFEERLVEIVQSQTVSGTVVAKDTLMVAIGGLIENEEFLEKDQVPILGDIPLLGILFRREEKRNTRRELVVLIRPYVLNTPGESERLSEDLLERLGLNVQERLDMHNADRKGLDGADTLRKRFRFHGAGPEDE